MYLFPSVLRLCFFLLSLFAIGCGGSSSDSKEITLKFAAKVGEKEAKCGETYRDLGTKKSSVTLNGIRFFVSNIRLIDNKKKEHLVDLAQDRIWQYQDVALLDFEDASNGCAEVGSKETNETIRGRSSDFEVSGIKFDLGLPFDLNHLDPTTSPSPLNISSMNWFWQVGHILFRADMVADGKPWFIHLGSSGCTSPSPTTSPTLPCSRPNVPTISLNNYSLDKIVVLDLATLVNDVDLTRVTPDTAPGCMSESEDGECTEVLPNFGLSLTDGKCEEDCRNQTAFYVN
jgi:uncharacterized repeat protein (TIGR04052 family)